MGARRPPRGRDARGPRLFVCFGLRPPTPHPRVSGARGLRELRARGRLTGPRLGPGRGAAARVSPRPHSPRGARERLARGSLRGWGCWAGHRGAPGGQRPGPFPPYPADPSQSRNEPSRWPAGVGSDARFFVPRGRARGSAHLQHPWGPRAV